jgi:putative oxidoreductase
MNRFFPTFVEGPGAIGLLILRLVSGIAFVLHSIPLLEHPTRWMNELHLPSPAPASVQFLAAFGQFVCGLAILVGIVTPLASIALGIIMAGAIFTVHLPRGDAFVTRPGEPSSELAVLYLAIMVVLLLVGPGTLSLDALFFRRKPSWL